MTNPWMVTLKINEPWNDREGQIVEPCDWPAELVEYNPSEAIFTLKHPSGKFSTVTPEAFWIALGWARKPEPEPGAMTADDLAIQELKRQIERPWLNADLYPVKVLEPIVLVDAPDTPPPLPEVRVPECVACQATGVPLGYEGTCWPCHAREDGYVASNRDARDTKISARREREHRPSSAYEPSWQRNGMIGVWRVR